MSTPSYSASIAQRGKGILRTFNDAGVLSAADVHVAVRLGALGQESDDGVLLAIALAVRAVRAGSVCLDMTRFTEVTLDGDAGEFDVESLPWPDPSAVLDALRRSPLTVGGERGPLRPVRLVDTDSGPLLYLERYYLQEKVIRDVLDRRSATLPPVDVSVVAAALDRFFPAAAAPDRQRIAAALAATTWTTVIAGGPGTGKTHTVARILALLTDGRAERLRIGLAAPTGKAAARLQESVSEQASGLGLSADIAAMTLHRLLGWQPGSRSRFKYDAHNALPYDVVVVDETSMVSLTMMSRLLEAMRDDARLVLVGDPDQLTSVDAGAVLADLVARPVAVDVPPALTELVGADLEAADDPDEKALGDRERQRLGAGIVRLSRGRRFGGHIARLAVAIRDGDDDEVMRLLSGGHDDVVFDAPTEIEALELDVVVTARAVTDAATRGDASSALAEMERHRLLCAHREGPFGVDSWARWAAERVGTAQGVFLDSARWYPGQPLLVTANDHDTKIYNGDTGVVVDDGRGGVTAAFARGDEPFLVHPSRLSSVHTVYAMTIHRSQGSQYDTVSVVIPGEESSLLTRELLYTAVTRARSTVRVIGTEAAVRAGVRRQVLRASGLRRQPTPDPGVR